LGLFQITVDSEKQEQVAATSQVESGALEWLAGARRELFQ
jgi:hypothetical protein